MREAPQTATQERGMTATEKPNLTLYGIETQLLELLNFRESIESDPDMTPQEQQESLKACDESIAEYIRAEVKKCDGIARYLREFEARAAALKEEAARCTQMAKNWQKRYDSLEAMVIDIMQVTKQTRIDGRHSVLQLKKNPPSVEIVQPGFLPADLVRVAVKLTVEQWGHIINWLKPAPSLQIELSTAVAGKDPEPMKDEIKKRLKEGDGVPGCRLRTDGVRLEVK
jgi:hypothetical protein